MLCKTDCKKKNLETTKETINKTQVIGKNSEVPEDFSPPTIYSIADVQKTRQKKQDARGKPVFLKHRSFEALETITGGFRMEELTLLCGPTFSGKTLFAGQFSVLLQVETSMSVGFYKIKSSTKK